MSFCADCFKGVRHEGTPAGKVEQINGVDTYVALPEGDYPKDKAILFLTDVFGLQLINNKLLADDFAQNGFAVYLPDYLNGDPVPDDAFSGTSNFSVADWIGKHGREQTRPLLDKVIKGLQERGVTTFGATGYCYGGRYTFDLAFDRVIKVSVVAHPSLLEKPADLEKYASSATAPLLINSCETDGQFPPEAQKQADDILGNGKFAPGYSREYFDGCTHGFAVRGDMSDPTVKAGKEGAFKASIDWFHKYM